MVRPRFALPVLLALLTLAGCTLPRAQIRRADRLVAASTLPDAGCRRADHCAIDSPLLQAARQAMAQSTPDAPRHVIALLDDSEPALVARLNLIRAARRSIDVQTYIWDQDDAGQLMLDELIRAARRGVRVRILADQLGSFNSLALLDQLARASPDFQVKLYNPTFQEARTSPFEWVAGIACCFAKFNQRMHNKVLLVDDTVGITGGRNYEDRYFDWDDDFDYVDRDVLVGGPAAHAMADSFALFWNHRRSVALTHLRDVNHYILSHPQAPGWSPPHYVHPQRVYRAEQEATDAHWLRAHVLADSLQAGDVEFFSDLPAKTEQPKRRRARQFTRHLMQMVAGARHEVVLQTPYLVLSKRAGKLFAQMHARASPPRIIVSTNSLASTDAFMVYALSYKHRKRYLTRYGFEIHELKPHASGPTRENDWASMAGDREGGTEPRPARPHATNRFEHTGVHALFGSRASRRQPAPLLSNGRRFGLHAKSIVVDDRFAMVGSHNFDPRSDHYNTEAGVIVYDRRFADQLRRSILRDTLPQNAWVIAPRQPAVPVLTKLNQLLGDVSEKLPLFDFWPYRYATSYQLKDGCTPMRPSDPGFFSCYEPVGDFPDVALSPKRIYTRLVTAFGSSASGIL